MNEYQYVPLGNNVTEMFIGPFGSDLKNETFVRKEEGYCVVYEQKHAIKKIIDDNIRYITKEKYESLKRFRIDAGDIIVSVFSRDAREYYQLDAFYSGVDESQTESEL